MKNPLTILFVEDNPNHISDLRTKLDAELPRLPITINSLWAANLEEAMQLWDQFHPDAVMTDVFFPDTRGGGDQEPNGQKIVERCFSEQKPVVWVTSTYHHGERTDPVSRWGRQRGLEMFDYYLKDSDAESPHKPWKEALYGLFYTILCLENDQLFFMDGKLVGPEYEYKGAKCRDRFIFDTNTANQYLSSSKIDTRRYPIMQTMVELGFPRT